MESVSTNGKFIRYSMQRNGMGTFIISGSQKYFVGQENDLVLSLDSLKN